MNPSCRDSHKRQPRSSNQPLFNATCATDVDDVGRGSCWITPGIGDERLCDDETGIDVPPGPATCDPD